MKATLKTKLHQFVVEHNPELLWKLQEDFTLTSYINDKVEQVMTSVKQWLAAGIPVYEVEEMALKSMTSDLRPSRYLYLKGVMESDFPKEAKAFAEAGVLTYELVNLIEHCRDTFTVFSFSEENEDSRKLRYAVISDIADYLS